MAHHTIISSLVLHRTWGAGPSRKTHSATCIYLLADFVNCINCQPNGEFWVIQVIYARYCPQAIRARGSTIKPSMAQSKPKLQTRRENSGKQPVEAESPLLFSGDDPKAIIARTLTSPVDAESYFTSIRSSRANSIYSISRISFSSQFTQLTNLHLPDAASLSSSIAGLPSAAAAANTLNVAADEIRKWLKKAKDVLNGLDAEDDVEWAAAGGREGLCEVDAAIGRFEGLITVYVTAIEDLQGREDVATVPSELGGLVEQMEKILQEWEGARKLLKGVKSQVELAMEWEELWNHVLGDIGLEVENLGRLVFEMEEARHTAMFTDTKLDNGATIDMQELETIVEEAPATNGNSSNHRFSLPPAFAAMSPTSPAFSMPQEDSRLLALFARMQPLRASLDFLPMTLSSFRTKAMATLPTACQELDDRRRGLEKRWKELEKDAEGLRRELGEDRWVLVFRNAGRQAQKLCESVERSISKLQESIDLGTQHSNPPVLAKKVESYEAKKIHYGPAIERVLAIIDKGVKDRLTVNGEILRLQQDTRARWKAIEAEIKDMDLALDDLTMNRNQQLRDSISTIVSMDRSATNSVVDTPGSSPASSPVLGPTGSSKGEPPHSGLNGSSRRSSIISNTTSRPSSSRRHASITQASTAPSELPLKNSISRSFSDSRNASPSPYSRTASTPIPGSRAARPSLASHDYKPRWNSSARVDHLDFSRNSKPSPLPTPPSHRRTSMTFRPPPLSAPPRSTNPPLPSPLGRSSAPSPAPPLTLPRARTQTSLGMRQTSFSSPARPPPHDPHPKARGLASTPQLSYAGGPRRQSSISDRVLEEHEEASPSPSVRPRPQRPVTAMAGRRNSMLPLPRAVIESGRESSAGMRVGSQ